MPALYAWLRRHPRLVDGVLAAVVAVIGSAQARVTHGLLWVPLALALAVPVVLRRRYPVGAFAAGIMVGAGQVLFNIRPTTTDFAVPVLLYTLAAYAPRRVSLAGLAVCLVGSAVAVARWLPPLHLPSALVVGTVMFAGPSVIAWAVGDSMRYRRAYYAGLEERAARLERERDAQAQVAAAAERARIARELHDVVAHNVSVMVVQADGASYALDRDPDRARQALAAIAGTGRQALAEMRRLLGVLRTDGPDPALAPLPGITELTGLLDQARTAGLPVDFTVTGEPRPLPGGAALAAYRIVQESLTNTRKHAGPRAAATVTLRYGPGELALTIADDGRGAAAAVASGGHGLTGMRERVALYGGTLTAGPRPGGGFEVTAVLPLAGHGQPAQSGESGQPAKSGTA